MSDPIAQFSNAIGATGLTPPEHIEADGKLRRFSPSGKRADDAGWYVLHADGIPAGIFGDWRSGFTQSWRADIGRPLTAREKAAHRARIEAARQARDAEDAARKTEAREQANLILAEAWAGAGHLYLSRKRIGAYGTKVVAAGVARRHAPALSPYLGDGPLLVVPMRDAGGVLHSLQFINAEGTKRPLTGGRVAGCYHSIGSKPVDVLCVAEGFATGATIHEATGHPVAVAFSASNLRAVAQALRDKLPHLRLVLCADDDMTPGNPGLTKANEAAQAVGAAVAIPKFGPDRPQGATDFNDMAALSGLAAVRACIEVTLNATGVSHV